MLHASYGTRPLPQRYSTPAAIRATYETGPPPWVDNFRATVLAIYKPKPPLPRLILCKSESRGRGAPPYPTGDEKRRRSKWGGFQRGQIEERPRKEHRIPEHPAEFSGNRNPRVEYHRSCTPIPSTEQQKSEKHESSVPTSTDLTCSDFDLETDPPMFVSCGATL